MSVLHNVRAFLGLSPQDGEHDAYHFGIKDDDTGALYFEDDDDTDEDVSEHDDVDEVVDEDDSESEVVAVEDPSVLDDTSEQRTYGYDYEAEDDASVEITFEDGSKEIRIIETERPKDRSQRSSRESQQRSRVASGSSNRSTAGRIRATPDPAVELQEARPKVVKPRSFADAQTVADGFKANVPIVMNLTAVDQELARRLIDFASGICYIAGGEMDRIRSRVFLLTPRSASLSVEDRRLLASRRYDR